MVTTQPQQPLAYIRLHYFIWLGGFGFLLPYLGLFYRDQGLTGTEIGMIGMVEAVVALLAAPLWGRWSDRMHRPRRVLQTALLATALAALWFGRQNSFVGLATAVSLYTLTGVAIFTLSDTLTLNVLSHYEGVGFGSIRSLGSLGWALVTAVSGRFIDRFGFYLGFIIYAIGLVGSALVVNRIPATLSRNPAPLQPSAPPIRSTQLLRELWENPVMRGLALGLVFAWMVGIPMQPFEAIYLKELGASTGMVGLSFSVTAFVEVPAMIVADRLLKRFGASWMFRTALGLEIVRVGIILAFTAVPTIIGVRIISGFTFSLYSITILSVIRQHAPGGQSATVLALYTVTLRFLLQIVGGPLCGFIFDTLGGYWLYVGLLFTNIASWFVFTVTVKE